MRKAYPLAAVAILACGCAGPTKTEFLSTAEQFAYESLALSPISATQAGYHTHRGAALDDRLDDSSPAEMERQRRFYRDYRTRLESGFHPDDLSADDRADYDIARDQIELALLELETIQNYKHNPTVYVEGLGQALYAPFVLEYAPKEERYRHIVSRLERTPEFLENAKRNLLDSPEIWNAVAQEENDGNAGLIEGPLKAGVPEGLRADFDRASGPALAAIRDFTAFLKSDLAARKSDWRLGPDKYAKKFRYTLATDQAADQVLANAEHELESIRQRMYQLAGKLNPGGKTADLNQTVSAALAKIALHHATVADYFSGARRDLAETTAFVRDKGLLTLPSNSNLKVIETPEFMRGIYSVGGFSPAPTLEPQLGAFYWLTPIPANWNPGRVESKLREYNFFGMKLLTIHEAMPGHYVQAEYANAIEPKSRRVFRSVFGNGPYVEGWAVYATEMMLDQGYLENNPELRLTFQKQMLRAIANTILDIRLQTKGMTDQQAMDLMLKDTFQENEEATGKLRRAKLSSCQLPTYYVGWRDWRRLRDQYRNFRHTAFSLREFHEQSLKAGAVPVPVLARILTGYALQ